MKNQAKYPEENYVIGEGFSTDFQTLPVVADFMASLLPENCGLILEPTPGIGILAKAARKKGWVYMPRSFEEIPAGYRCDAAIMNPPFTPMKEGYRFLTEVMKMTDNIVVLLPWLILINSDLRIKAIMDFGLVSVTHLPRKAFRGSRVQCCVLEMKKGYVGQTKFETFNW